MHYLEEEFNELMKSNAEVMAFIQSSISDGIWYLNLVNQKDIWTSERFWRTFGYEKSNLPQEPFQLIDQIINKEDQQKAHELWAEYFGGKSDFYEQILRYKHANGSIVYIRCRGIVIKSEDGAPTRMMGIHLDITSTELLRQSLVFEKQHLLQGIYQSLPGAVIQYTLYPDGTDKLDYVTDSITNLYGITAQEALESSSAIWSKIDTQDLEMMRTSIVHSANTLEPWQAEWRVNLDNGNIRWIHGIGQPSKSFGNSIQWTTVLLDITDKKKIELERSWDQRRFELMINAGMDVVLITSPERLIFVSENVKSLLGYSVQEFFNIPLTELVHPDDFPLRWDLLEEVGSSATIEYRAKHKMGHYMWLLASGKNMSNVPEIGGILFSLRDINEIKQKEEELRLLNARLDEKVKIRTAELLRSQYMLKEAQRITNLGSWEMDVKTGVILWSEEMHQIMGVPVSSGIPSFEEHADFMSRQDFLKLQQAVSDAISNGVAYEFDIALRRPDEKYIWVSCRGNPIRDKTGQVIRLVGTLQDITERKTAELELQLKSIQLEETNKELEAFSYSVSHDLRAPLRGIHGWSTALFEDYESQLDQNAKDYLLRIRNEATQMDELIEGLLKLSKVARSEMSPELVNISDLVARTLDRMKIVSNLPKVELRIQSNLTVRADRGLLRTVIENLCSNAIKFSSKKENPLIEFGMKVIEDENVFYLKDNGVGLDMKKVDNVFSPFRRFHKKSDFEGMGIGLATVKRAVAMHNGRIWMESEPNLGTTILFTLHI